MTNEGSKCSISTGALDRAMLVVWCGGWRQRKILIRGADTEGSVFCKESAARRCCLAYTGMRGAAAGRASVTLLHCLLRRLLEPGMRCRHARTDSAPLLQHSM